MKQTQTVTLYRNNQNKTFSISKRSDSDVKKLVEIAVKEASRGYAASVIAEGIGDELRSQSRAADADEQEIPERSFRTPHFPLMHVAGKDLYSSDGFFNLEMAKCRTANPFDDVQRFSVRQTTEIEPRPILEADGLNHECVAVPASNGITHERRIGIGRE